MGGRGSGSWQHGKPLVGDTLALSVLRLHKKRLLISNLSYRLQWQRNGRIQSVFARTSDDGITLSFKAGKNCEWQEHECNIQIRWMRLHLGGQRPFFVCPVCGRQSCLLYFNGSFMCRICAGLRHRTQRLSPPDRVWSRLTKIRKRLRWPVAGDEGIRPRGMRRQTFDRLLESYKNFDHKHLVAVCKRLGITATG